MIPLGFVVLGVLLGLSCRRTSAGEKVSGTSEIAAQVTFGLGGLACLWHFTVVLAGAVITTRVLSLRDELCWLPRALSYKDLLATVQFASGLEGVMHLREG